MNTNGTEFYKCFLDCSHVLTPATELRFIASDDNDVKLELLEGDAEINGSEVLHKRNYTFPSCSSVSLFTWKGCRVKTTGTFEKLVLFTESSIMFLVHIHACLEHRRRIALNTNNIGPVSLVVGPTDVGKTSFCHFMLNYASRLGRQPYYIDLSVDQTSLSMPGTVSALPIEREVDITDGFYPKPVAVYPFGHISPRNNIVLYYLLITKIANYVKTQVQNADQNTQASGMIIDTCGWVREQGYTAITLAALSFEITNLFVIEDEELFIQLKKDMPLCVEVVYVSKQNGVYERSRALRAKRRDDHVRQYFYGKNEFRPLTTYELKVKFSDVNIYTFEPPDSDTVVNELSVTASDINVIKVKFGPELENSVLGLSSANEVDENLMLTYIIGFVCVTSVDMKKELITLLSKQPEPLSSKILILGEMKFKP